VADGLAIDNVDVTMTYQITIIKVGL